MELLQRNGVLVELGPLGYQIRERNCEEVENGAIILPCGSAVNAQYRVTRIE
jgi:hypothetical protein